MAEPRSAGLLASLRTLLDSALDLAHARLALLGNELEEQKLRVAHGLLLAAVGLVLLTVAVLLLCGFVLLLFREGHRLAALGVLTVAFGGGAVFALRAAREQLRSPQAMFQASLDELARDRDRVGFSPEQRL
ncbi:MAG TPA: phage holin family protein [Ramlibacter sp.]|nr:phage holin family protein [Ramlibacter sp.]